MNIIARPGAVAAAGLFLFLACSSSDRGDTPAPASSTTTSSSSSSSSASSSASSSSSSSSSSSGQAGGIPPGCMDGGHRFYAFRIDDTHVRIGSADGTNAEVCAGNATRPNNCYFDYVDFVLTLPSGVKSATWTLPDANVTLTRMKYFPRTVSEAGCTCQPAETTPLTITSGTVQLGELDGGPGYGGARAYVTLDGVQSFDGGRIVLGITECP